MKDVPKPFLEHLEDLRITFIKMGATLVVATVLCFIFRRPVLEILYKPLIWAGESPDKFLKVLGVVDPFMLALQIAFFAGFLFSLPLLLYFGGLFVLPALTDDERKMIAPVFFGGTGLFVGGVAFCYYVLLPQALKFFLNFSVEMGFQAEWTVQNYIGFVVQMLAALGICFELPMVILILAKLGLVDAKMLSTHRRHALVAIIVLAAIITPTQDVFTLALMSGPMWLLYEACVVICWWMERKEREREAREARERALARQSAPAVVPAAVESAYPEGDPYEELMGGGDDSQGEGTGGDVAKSETTEGESGGSETAGGGAGSGESGEGESGEGGMAGGDGDAASGADEPEDRAEYPSPNDETTAG
ncbi:MAG: twin-arginine translocase subunit TatC [Verrucomicrobiae bacterium]|nr:twin-arginine translocase subunit TatC [Verrucomicrobiae bacterium]